MPKDEGEDEDEAAEAGALAAALTVADAVAVGAGLALALAAALAAALALASAQRCQSAEACAWGALLQRPKDPAPESSGPSMQAMAMEGTPTAATARATAAVFRKRLVLRCSLMSDLTRCISVGTQNLCPRDHLTRGRVEAVGVRCGPGAPCGPVILRRAVDPGNEG
jgi:hypothetical protein